MTTLFERSEAEWRTARRLLQKARLAVQAAAQGNGCLADFRLDLSMLEDVQSNVEARLEEAESLSDAEDAHQQYVKYGVFA